jgi:hypothetical protein
MRISFNVDDTLILHDAGAPREYLVPWYWRWWYNEPLRLGTRELMLALLKRKCDVCLYTNAIRSPHYLRRWFKTIGIPLTEVVDAERHDAAVRSLPFTGYTPSKYPPAFGIDLHVDDSEGVAEEGRMHGFHVLVVGPDDPDWVERVLAAVDQQCKKNAATDEHG